MKSSLEKLEMKSSFKNYIPSMEETHDHITLDEIVKRFFELDAPQSLIDNQEAMSAEDLLALKIWEEDSTFTDGHDNCPIPFRRPDPKMPDSKPMTLKRLALLKRRFIRDPALHQEFTEKMNKLFAAGHAELAPPDIPEEWTLPLFPAFHPFKPGPRPVFDCAAEVQGTSLNSTVLSGPNLVNILLEVFLRFRKGLIRYIGDIECMFYQIRVPPKDRKYLRFYWFPDGDINMEPQEYQLTVHLFGGTWSPAVSAFCLRKAALEQMEQYGPDIVETILKHFYVDDLLHSMDLIEQSKLNVAHVRECLKNRCFNLTKFISNSKELLSSIPPEHRAKEIRELDLDSDTLPIERALGQFWNADKDAIIWVRKLKEKPFTKRGVLSTVSSAFDPAGYISPLTLEAKVIFQSECRQGHNWDQELSPENAKRWKKWLQELPEIENFSMPCGYFPPNFGKVISLQLHNFCDGSSVAYGSVHYLRAQNEAGDICTSLVLAKNRLKPINCKDNLTIPKTELCAAVQAAQLSRIIEQYLEMKIECQY